LGAVALMLLPSYVPGSNKFYFCLGWKILNMLSIKIYNYASQAICLVNIMTINVLRKKKIAVEKNKFLHHPTHLTDSGLLSNGFLSVFPPSLLVQYRYAR